MSYKRCCVPGCISAGSETILHEFPNPAKDIDRFMKWIYSIGGDILNLTNEYIYKNRRVCRKHFDEMYYCRSNRLSNIALPTICMPSVVMHVFPNPRKYPERFKDWVNLVGGNLTSLSDKDIYQKKRICDIHFLDDHRTRNKRLSTLAIPTLLLPGSSATQDPLDIKPPTTATISSADLNISGSSATQDPLDIKPPTTATISSADLNISGSSATQDPLDIKPPTTATISSADLNISGSSATRDPLDINQPTTATTSSADLTISEGIQRIVAASDDDDDDASTVTAEDYYSLMGVQQNEEIELIIPASDDEDHNDDDGASTVTAEHYYDLMGRCVQQRSQKDIPARRPVYSYAQMKSLQSKIKHMRTKISRLRKRELLYKERLAEKLSKDIAFQVTKHVTKPTQLFTHMQLQTKNTPKGLGFGKKFACSK